MVRPSLSKRAIFVIVLVVLVAIPTIAFAGTLFADVDDASPHIAGITFMKNSGVTIGCGPNIFCPKDPVTREQMATFMYRLSGTDPLTPRSVDADKVDGYDGADLLNPAYSTWNDGPIAMPGTGTLLSLAIPSAGAYVIWAKAWLFNTSGSDVLVKCTLQAGADFDETRVGLEQNGSGASGESAAFNVVHHYTVPGVATLWCDDFGVNDVQMNDAKITAIRVGSLSNVPG